MPTAVTERLDSPRILAGTAAEIRVTVHQDGEPVDVSDSPAPTVVLTNADTGATITPATGVAEEATGKLVQVLSPTETTVRRLKAVWSCTVNSAAITLTTYHEVVGALLFALSEARAFDRDALADDTRYTDLAILEARDQIAEAFEDICDVSFGTRATREVHDGPGGSELWLERMMCDTVSAAAIREHGTQTWTALTSDELADLLLYPNGKLVRESLGSWTVGRRNVRVDYSHGYQGVPLEIKRAALMVLRDQAPGSNIGMRALSETNDLGTFRLAVPGENGRWFGIPAVDEALSRYRRKVPAVG